MIGRGVARRLQRLEAVHPVSRDGVISITLEDLLRAIWRDDKNKYVKSATENGFGAFLIPQFEREDAERARRSLVGGRK
jgi:hypothetical protein